MKWLRVLLVGFLALGIIVPTPASALSSVQPPAEPSKEPLKVSAYSVSLNTTLQNGALAYVETPHYIELYNDSSQPVNLAEYTLQMTDTQGFAAVATALESMIPSRYIAPGQFLAISFNKSVANAQLDVSNDPILYESKPLVDREIQLFRGQVGVYAKSIKLKIDAVDPQTRLIYRTVTAEEQAEERLTVYDNQLYSPRMTFPLAPIEILANPRACSPVESNDVACREYVKFYNNTDSTISFDDVRLRVGYFGQTSSSSNTLQLTGDISQGQYVYFEVPLTNSGGYVWLEDYYGVLPFENTVVEYVDASSTSRKGLSWALFGNEWNWATPNPGGGNIRLSVDSSTDNPINSLTPCRPDQYRNPLTNRCKLKETTEDSLKLCAPNQYRNPLTNRCKLKTSSTTALVPCGPGQFRNPLTNRCKSTSSSASTLVPCKPNQYRNPETNRCKSLTSGTALKPCQTGWERNPETNRCRKTRDASVLADVDHAVQPFSDSPGQANGWLAFGAVGSLAASYGVWEWRRELGGLFGKLRGLVGK